MSFLSVGGSDCDCPSGETLLYLRFMRRDKTSFSSFGEAAMMMVRVVETGNLNAFNQVDGSTYSYRKLSMKMMDQMKK